MFLNNRSERQTFYLLLFVSDQIRFTCPDNANMSAWVAAAITWLWFIAHAVDAAFPHGGMRNGDQSSCPPNNLAVKSQRRRFSVTPQTVVSYCSAARSMDSAQPLWCTSTWRRCCVSRCEWHRRHFEIRWVSRACRLRHVRINLTWMAFQTIGIWFAKKTQNKCCCLDFLKSI